jgi:hypothetical protein
MLRNTSLPITGLYVRLFYCKLEYPVDVTLQSTSSRKVMLISELIHHWITEPSIPVSSLPHREKDINTYHSVVEQ